MVWWLRGGVSIEEEGVWRCCLDYKEHMNNSEVDIENQDIDFGKETKFGINHFSPFRQ